MGYKWLMIHCGLSGKYCREINRFIMGTRKLLENPDEMAEDGGVSNLQWTGIIQMGVAVL